MSNISYLFMVVVQYPFREGETNLLTSVVHKNSGEMEIVGRSDSLGSGGQLELPRHDLLWTSRKVSRS